MRNRTLRTQILIGTAMAFVIGIDRPVHAADDKAKSLPQDIAKDASALKVAIAEGKSKEELAKLAENLDKNATALSKKPEAPMKFLIGQATWAAVVFLLFLFLLTKFAWKPLSEGMAERESRIRSDIETAENNRKKAEEMLAEYESKLAASQEEVREILAEARRDADVARQNILDDANKEADATKQRAITEIERAKDAALKEIFAAEADRVASATEHVLGRAVTDDDQRRLIDEALNQIGA